MGKKRKKPKLDLNAAMTRPERMGLVLAWARRVGKVRIDGNTYQTPDGWVDEWLLTHRTVGGTSATRRLREMRQDPARFGPIERRASVDADGNTVVEYRHGDRDA